MTGYSCASPDEQYTEHERRNRDVVLEFYEAGVNRRDYAAAFRHLGDRYIQHNRKRKKQNQHYTDCERLSILAQELTPANRPAIAPPHCAQSGD